MKLRRAVYRCLLVWMGLSLSAPSLGQDKKSLPDIPQIKDHQELLNTSEKWKQGEVWPYAMMLPMEMKMIFKKEKHRRSKNADVLIWVSPKTQKVRSLMLVPQNTDSKHIVEMEGFRELAKKHDMVVIYMRKPMFSVMERSGEFKYTQALLDRVAVLIEKPGVSQAPWVVFGKSSQGRHPFYMMWRHPDRTIAAITYHGEVPRWPMSDWSELKNQTIPYLTIHGHQEWMGTWYRHVRPNFLNYRQHTGLLPHQVVIRHLGHGNYKDGHGSKGWAKPVPKGHISVREVWDYIILFTDKVLELRLPKDQFPAEGPVTLKRIDLSVGYLVHPRAMEQVSVFKQRPIRQNANGRYVIVDHIKEPHEVYAEEQMELNAKAMIRPYTEVPEVERKQYYWMPDRELIEAWKKLQTKGNQP